MADGGSEARAFIRRLPKIDLHAHLEGSVSRGALGALARRHRCSVPRLRDFEDFRGFLRTFGAVCDLLRDEDDFRLAVRDVLGSARRQGIAHVELRVSPQVFLRRGVPLRSIMSGLLEGRREATRRYGVSSIFIVDGVRQWGPEWFREVVRSSRPYAGKGVAGVGLGGDEASLGASGFARAFREAREMGLRSTVHAGETGGAESVWEALRILKADRIGHGVGAVEDRDLIAELVRRRVTLEICPTSNVATGAVGSLDRHPVRNLFEAGVRIAVGSDDGTLFGTDLVRELEILARRFAFTREEIGRLTAHAALSSFLPEGGRRALGARIRAVVRRMACD